MRKILFAVIVLLALGIVACQKQSVETPPETNTPPLTRDTSYSPLSYGDSIFYLKNQPGNYTILPISKPETTGFFESNPQGLVLDSITGQINVTQSETGLRYKVYSLSVTGERLDSVKLVISGIDYADGIYELQATPVAYDTAFPIYNARPELPLPCRSNDDDDDDDGDDDDGDDDDDQGCIFDETDLNDDGNDDIPGVIQDKLLVNKNNGTLDLEASFHAGVFGSSDPANGVTKDFTFYYRLTDVSNKALNKITVRLFHFKKRSDIPQSLLSELNNRWNTVAEINSRLMGRFIESKAKRPPIIIIVSHR